MIKYIFAILFPLALFLRINFEVLALVEYENVNPGNDLSYTFKRLKEKITLFFLTPFTDKKLDYYKRLIEVRLAELKYVTDKKDIANIQTTTQRYSATAGELTDLVIGYNTLFGKKEDIKNMFMDHLKAVDEFKKSYNDTTAEWRFVEHVSDSIKLYSAKLGN